MELNEAKKRGCEREKIRVDALRTYIYAYTHAYARTTCVRVRVPHCGLEEVERIRENRVSFRSASARGLGPFVLSSRNPEEEDDEEEEEEEDISRVRAGRKRRKPSRRDGPPRRNRPTVPCYYLRSRGESAFLPGSLPSFLPSFLTLFFLLQLLSSRSSSSLLLFPCSLASFTFLSVSFLRPSMNLPSFSDVFSRKSSSFSRLRIDTVKLLNFGGNQVDCSLCFFCVRTRAEN